MRSSISFKILPVTMLMAGLVLAGRADALTSTFPGTTWEIKTPADVDLDAAKLALVQAEMGGNGYITRYGYQVFTWGDIVRRTTYASSCKPWFSTFLMIALDKGLTPSADAKAVNYWPCLNDINASLGFKDRNITLRHLANQYSCYGVQEDPGTAFDYNDWQMSLFTDVMFIGIYGATPSDVDQTVFNPYLGNFLRFEDNATMKHLGTGDDAFRPGHSMRDFARFGLLYLRQGTWVGTQVVSRARAIQAVTSPLPNSLTETNAVVTEMCPNQRNFGSNTVSQGDHRGSYSWAWWGNGVDRNGNRLWPDAPLDTYVAHGSGGGAGLRSFPASRL